MWRSHRATWCQYPDMSIELDALVSHLKDDAASLDAEGFERIAIDIEKEALFVGTVSHALVETIVGIFSSHRASPGAWKLLYLVANLWELLEGEGRQLVTVAAIDVLFESVDCAALMVAAEILGERVADRFALDTLTQVSQRPHVQGRLLVPHGLYLLARTTGDHDLQGEAERRLIALARGADEALAAEAEAALASLRKRRDPDS